METKLLTALFIAVISTFFNPLCTAQVYTEYMLSGEVSNTSVVLLAKLTENTPSSMLNEQKYRFVIFEKLNPNIKHFSDWTVTNSESEIITQAFSGLTPMTKYDYYVEDESGQPLSQEYNEFSTLPGSSIDTSFNFIIMSCFNIERERYNTDFSLKEDRSRDTIMNLYRGHDAIRRLAPGIVIYNGDNVYYHHGPRTVKTRKDMFAKWNDLFTLSFLKSLNASTSGYWMMDDHDYRFNDSDNSTSRFPTPEDGIHVFRAQTPNYSKNPLYKKIRVSQKLELWLLEGRQYRDNNNEEDSPSKTLWGEQQKEWLMNSLKESTAMYKVIVSPTPIVGPDARWKTDNHTSGFKFEGSEFQSWLSQNFSPQEIVLITGDRHWKYHSINKFGFSEISVGALNTKNATAALGMGPGSAASTDYDGKITQLFKDREARGGFLEITQLERDLVLKLRDQDGQELYRFELRTLLAGAKNNDGAITVYSDGAKNQIHISISDKQINLNDLDIKLFNLDGRQQPFRTVNASPTNEGVNILIRPNPPKTSAILLLSIKHPHFQVCRKVLF